MAKKNKFKEPIKLDVDISFDEAMERILSANPKGVEKKVKKAQEQKLLSAPISKKLLPKPKK
jgi:hypothetical protein